MSGRGCFFLVWLGFSQLLWAAGAESPGLPPPPESTEIVEVFETIVITESGVKDFENKLHVWKGQDWDCTADKENGPQILRIEADDVTIKNFHFVGDGSSFGSNGLGDPIHVTSCGRGQGNKCPPGGPLDVVLDGIYGHACEDLVTVGTPGTARITIQNSYLKANPDPKSWDKTIQINFGDAINFYNNIFVGGSACIRYMANTNGEVIGNSFYGCKNAVRASGDLAPIEPMEPGPVRIRYKDNKCFNCKQEIQILNGDVKVTRQ